MDELIIVLIIVAIGFMISGPIGLIMAIILLNRTDRIERRLENIEQSQAPKSKLATPAAMPPAMQAAPPQAGPQPGQKRTIEDIMKGMPSLPQKSERPEAAAPQSLMSPERQPRFPAQKPSPQTGAALHPGQEAAAAMRTLASPKIPETNMEVKIGTRAALITGVITVIVAAGFFLKYVYENQIFDEKTRVFLVTAGGILSLILGEITRRKDFGIVAKGMTALGFALFYAAVFSAERVYHLIDPSWAFGISVVITGGAMLYAVSLNEILIAFLSLLGGYLSPFIISMDQSLPIPLFSYVLVLSLGAIGCAAFRRWRAVNWVAFVGTYLLYTVWFEKFYRMQMALDGSIPESMSVALVWLGIFGLIYLVLPILNGLIQRTRSRAEDVCLVVANSIAAFYYLWMITYDISQSWLALASAIMGVIHLGMLGVALLRNKADAILQSVFGVMGTVFITASIPLYFKMQPSLIGWSMEAVVLTFIGIRYKSLWPKGLSLIVTGVAVAGLFYLLPMHKNDDFRFVLNVPFGTWMCVSLAALVCHLLWRFMPTQENEERILMTQIFYMTGLLLTAIALSFEWYSWCDWKIESIRQDEAWFLMGVQVIAMALVLALLGRPVCPRGRAVQLLGILTALIGSVYSAIAFSRMYYDSFMIILNAPFLFGLLFTGAILLSAWFLHKVESQPDEQSPWPLIMSLTGLILLWIILTEEVYYYWYCRNEYAEKISNWRFLAQMYMSIVWAVYGLVLLVIGFMFRCRGVRYLSMGIFIILLAKIFIFDTTTLRPEYRIAAFLTTGLILVGISFLYQYLKKKGFFDSVVNTPVHQKKES